MDDDFWKTPGGDALATAHGYILAAHVLRTSDQWMTNAAPIWRPTMQVLSHGVELLLKFPHLAHGAAPSQVAKSFGHDLNKLWKDPAADAVKAACMVGASKVWERAASSGQWPDDDFTLDPNEVLEDAVRHLSRLHGRESNFLLRYPDGPVRGPRPMFLAETFGMAVEWILNNPELYFQPCKSVPSV